MIQVGAGVGVAVVVVVGAIVTLMVVVGVSVVGDVDDSNSGVVVEQVRLRCAVGLKVPVGHSGG